MKASTPTRCHHRRHLARSSWRCSEPRWNGRGRTAPSLAGTPRRSCWSGRSHAPGAVQRLDPCERPRGDRCARILGSSAITVPTPQTPWSRPKERPVLIRSETDSATTDPSRNDHPLAPRQAPRRVLSPTLTESERSKLSSPVRMKIPGRPSGPLGRGAHLCSRRLCGPGASRHSRALAIDHRPG